MFSSVKRICLWSSPRNISTAFMYSWAQRKDTTVVDEPLYGYFLKHTGVYRPGSDEVLQQMETDARVVIEKVLLGNYATPVVFFKHLTNQAIDLDLHFMKEMVNLFFIRDPKKIIASFAEVIPNPSMLDVAMKMQFECFEFARKNIYKTIVVDSDDLLKNPEMMLQKICAACEIDFDKEMLHWQPGPKSYDGIWAPHWYANVHRSTGFERQQTSERELPAHLEDLYFESKKYYDYLYEFALSER